MSSREFGSLILTVTYIPPEANTTEAMYQLSDIISRHENAHPGAISIIAGDFNQSSLRKTLPKFHQHVVCHTRKDRTLDHCYTTIRGAYRSLKRAPLGDSDHNIIHLIPAYTTKLKREQPFKRCVRQWTSSAIDTLRECFNCTTWDVFLENSTSIDECTDTILDYVKFCEDLCVPTKTVTVYPNQKPWFNGLLRSKLKAKQTAFHSGNQDDYVKAKADLKKCIRSAKRQYQNKLESDISSTNPRDLWNGVQKIADYNFKSKSKIPDDPSLPDDLNVFYSRFDHPSPAPIVPAAAERTLFIPNSDTKREFLKLNMRKAPGPDNVSPRLLRMCASQLCGIFTEIFNWSLRICQVPVIFKSSVIIPVPKRTPVSTMNDYRPVALTSIVMKSFEKLVMKFMKSFIPDGFDPYQFAYKSKHSVDDAVSLALEFLIPHLDRSKPTYARLLFVDFSSAFNTILPLRLHDKLIAIGMDPGISNWVLDFLTNRPQVVKIGHNYSKSLILNTGAPQGCGLSPLLYSLMTFDCKSWFNNCLTIKFADDTTVVGLIDKDEHDYRRQVDELVMWCAANNLELNVGKTKEIIVDFRRNKTPLMPLSINGAEVETVDTFKFLGIHISGDLTWRAHIEHCVNKAQQRLFFLRRLAGFGLGVDLLVKFYRAVVESVLTVSITVWYGGSTREDRRLLNRVIRTSERIIGIKLPSLDDIYRKRMSRKTESILSDSSHPAHDLFTLLPSGKRYRAITTKSERHRRSFYPSAIRQVNGADPLAKC